MKIPKVSYQNKFKKNMTMQLISVGCKRRAQRVVDLEQWGLRYGELLELSLLKML